MAMTVDQAVVRIMECHDTVRRLYPSDYRHRLSKWMDMIRGVMTIGSLELVPAAIRCAASMPETVADKDAALLWLWAAAAELMADQVVSG